MISIIMSAYNESIHELQLSIKSILNQTINDFELIIIDDNPNYFQLRYYLLDISKKYKKIRVYFNNKNLGAAKSRNVGIENSLGDFIAIIDADDVSKFNRLEKQLKFLKYNNLDFVFSNYKRINHNDNISQPVYTFNSIINKKVMKYLFAYYENISLQSSWLAKKEVFLKLNGYRKLIIEDYDFNVRAITYGYNLGYQKDALVFKKERQNNIGSHNFLRQYVTFKSIQKFIKMNNYNNIMPLNNIKQRVAPFITRKEINKFSLFLKAGHGIKYGKNIMKNIFIFLYLLFSSKNAFSYLFHLFIIKIRTIKINKI